MTHFLHLSQGFLPKVIQKTMHAYRFLAHSMLILLLVGSFFSSNLCAQALCLKGLLFVNQQHWTLWLNDAVIKSSCPQSQLLVSGGWSIKRVDADKVFLKNTETGKERLLMLTNVRPPATESLPSRAKKQAQRVAQKDESVLGF